VLPIADGKFVLLSGYPTISRDYGANYSFLSLKHQGANKCEIGGDGRVIMLTDDTRFYKSEDYGATFTEWTVASAGLPYVYSFAMSSDGVYVTVNTYQQIFCSSDGGLNFTLKYTVSAGTLNSPDAVSMSASGQYQLVRTYGYYMNLSTDYGQTWNKVTSAGSRMWSAQAMSSSGQYMYAIAYWDPGPGLYKSTNYGATWSLTYSDPDSKLRTVSMSGNGQYIYACTYTSTYNSFRYNNNYGTNNSWMTINLYAKLRLAFNYSGSIAVCRDYLNDTLVILTGGIQNAILTNFKTSQGGMIKVNNYY
jgi:photosystem II stability/assembly factor-like uncharacterized protein